MTPTPADDPNLRPAAVVAAGSAEPDAVEPEADAAADPHARRHTQWVVVGLVVGSYLAFWWAGNVLGIPAQRGYDGSLLGQPGTTSAVAFLAAAGLAGAVTAIASLVIGRAWLPAGPLAAAAGLAAWSFRAGPIRDTILSADVAHVSTAVFYRLAVELALLALLVGACWLLLLPQFENRLVPPDRRFRLRFTAGTAQALLAQAALTGVGVLLLVPNAEKKQAVFGVMTAAFVATSIVHHQAKDETAMRLYWVGPVLVGLVGYVATALGGHAAEAVETGRLVGGVAALARPLPLDYVGAGGVGVVIGLAMTADDWHVARAYAVGGVVHAVKTSRRINDATADE
ncbi:MAG TPA: hypothetical protein VF796_24405, partial [Humisphaera sp.]